MKFSVITPTYNHKKFIATTIKSVLANKSDNYELEYIVVDGNSNDGTQDVVNEYIDHIDLFISEPDDGQTDAINKGFTHATGDIYAYINSDDYYYPGAFEKVAKIFSENPDIDVVYGNCTFVDEEGQFHRYFTEVEPFDQFRLTSCSDFIMQPATFWRAKIFNECNAFNKDLHFGFDWDMWSRMAKKGAKFMYLKELIAVNREFEETKTLSGGNKRLQELKKIVDKNKESIFPHAYYSYAYAEEVSSDHGSILRKMVYKVLSYKNILYNQKTRFDKHINGVLHHRPVLQKNASIIFPWYDDAKYVFIQLSTPPSLKDQSVKITINDKLNIDYHFKDHTGIVFLNIGKITGNLIDIKFQFEKETTRHTSIKQRLLDRVFPYSAFISNIKIISSKNVLDKNEIMEDENLSTSDELQKVNIDKNISLLMNKNEIEYFLI